MALTDYLVFVKITITDPDPAADPVGGTEPLDTIDVWREVGTYAAASDDAAQQIAALEHGDGDYSAAPARSWNPGPWVITPKATRPQPTE